MSLTIFTTSIAKINKLVILAICLLIATNVFATSSSFNLNSIMTTSSFLPPEQAFNVRFESSQESQIKIKFNIATGYYVYKDRLTITVTPKEQLKESITIPTGLFLVVPDGENTHKKEEILNGSFAIKVPLVSISPVLDTKITVSLQGCDGKSICYPPESYSYLIKASAIAASNSWSAKFKSLYTGTDLNNLDNSNYFVLLLLFFIAGCLISLTPCVYPLYPISLKALSYQNNNNTKLNKFFAVFAYIHGIAVVFMIVGVIAAYFGILLTSVIQSKYLIFFMVTILIVLGLSMLDLYEIKLPNFSLPGMEPKRETKSYRRYLNIFFIGITSAIFLGPCVTPPLLVAFGFIAHKSDVLFGILSLYCLTLGMNMPILLLALLGDKILPKSGVWMVAIKFSIGLLIIALAVSLIYPFIHLANAYLSIGLCLVVMGIIIMLLVRFKQLHGQNIYFILQLIFIIVGLALVIYGSVELDRLSQMGQNKYKDNFVVTQKVDKLESLLISSKKPILVDIYASWCVVCNEMRNSTFKDSAVINTLKNYTALQLDITDNEPEHYRFLKQYNLYGAPALLIFNSKHKLVTTLLGFVDAKTLKINLIKYGENNN